MEAVLDISEWDLFIAELSARNGRVVDYLKLAVQTKGRADVLDHFAKQRGPKERWKPRAASTQLAYARMGKKDAKYNPNNLLLQLSGRLKGSILPTGSEGGVRVMSAHSVMLYSAVKYSRAHDMGYPPRHLPQREFMYLSDDGKEAVAEVFLGALMEGL